MLRDIEEENQLWQAKDRRTKKKLSQNEQETEVDGAEEVAEEKTAGDTDPENPRPTSDVAKRPPDFY